VGYEGCTAKLRMERVILEDSFFDETEYFRLNFGWGF